MTERTKGPAVSMRRPPTRGPRDPWTPRKIALRGHFLPASAAPHRRRGAALGASPWPLRLRHPRRPTLDGPAHSVRLHILYAGGTSHTVGNPAPCHAPNAAKIGLAGLPEPCAPRATPRPYRAAHAANSLYWPSGPTGTSHTVGNPAPCHAPHAAKIGLTGFPAPRPSRATSHPAAPLTFLFSFPFRRWFHVAVRYFLRCGRVTDPPLQVQARGRGA